MMLPQAPMLTPSARKIHTRWTTRKAPGTIVVESMTKISCPISSVIFIIDKADDSH